MTIGEFFIKLGFQTTGAEQLDKIVKGMKDAEGKAIRVTLAVDAMNAAIAGLMYVSMNAALALNQFTLETGKSAEELEQWQYAAVKYGVSAKTVATSIESLQQATTAIRMGQGNIAPFQMLGIDPRQDAFKILEQVHQRILQMHNDPALAKYLVGQMGLGGMFDALAQPGFKVGDLQKQYIVTQQQAAALAALNGQWEQMKMKIQLVGEKVALSLAPSFYALLRDIEPVVRKIADFIVWLNSGTESAEKWRKGIGVLVVGLAALGVVLTTLTGIIGAFGIAVVGLELVLSPVLVPILAIGAAILGIATAIAEVIKAKNALKEIGNGSTWKGIEDVSNKEAGRPFKAIKDFNALPTGEAFASVGHWASSKIKDWFPAIMGQKDYGQQDYWNMGLNRIASGNGGTSNTVTQHNTVTIPISGARDPAATGSAVKSAMNQVLDSQVSAAADQIAGH